MSDSDSVGVCGICGFLGAGDESLLSAMRDILVHRGPDEGGSYLDEGVGLGHRRLTIIDLTTGRQPIHNEDEDIWIVFNGEVYNYPDLRTSLVERGHRFYTASDTETIVHLYEERSWRCVEELNGMFAFAMWDGRSRQLMLARDRCGVKPLYYAWLGSTLLFSSEIKSILCHEDVPRRVDPQALHYLLNLNYIPADLTLFQGIRKLLPGHVLVVRGNESEMHQYYDPVFRSTEASEDELVEKLRATLERAVRRHMIADVPVGSFLSGGIDTSTIVALMSRFSESPVHTFCMGFGEETDELRDARIVSEAFGTNHHELILDPYMGLELFPKAIWHVDFPKINLYPYFVAEFARKHVKVCNSGLGGDELFGGYIARYRKLWRIERLFRWTRGGASVGRPLRWLWIPVSLSGSLEHNKWKNYFESLGNCGDRAKAYVLVTGELHATDRKSLYGPRISSFVGRSVDGIFHPYFQDQRDHQDQILTAEFKTKLPDDFLLVDDGMSMAHSLEVRVPLLDLELLDLASTMPCRLKADATGGKRILKRAVKDMLPPEVLSKPKQGFSSDPYSWFVKCVREAAEDLVLGGDLVREGYLRDGFVKRILNHRPSPKMTRLYNLVQMLLSCELWHRIYISADMFREPNLNLDDFR